MSRLSLLITLARPFYHSDDPAHDWAHVLRVASNAEVLCKNEGIKSELVLAAVYCHDLVNLAKDHPDRKKASTLSAKAAERILIKSGYNNEEIEIIKQAIIEHSFSKGDKASCLEAAIVQDSDRLDALGSIGILRCAAVNAKMNSKFYDPQDPLAEARVLNDKDFMLDHYFVKLFKLPDLMNTKAAQILAIDRVEFMRNFVKQLMMEVRK